MGHQRPEDVDLPGLGGHGHVLVGADRRDGSEAPRDHVHVVPPGRARRGGPPDTGADRTGRVLRGVFHRRAHSGGERGRRRQRRLGRGHEASSAHERGEEAATNPIYFRAELDRLVALARESGRDRGPGHPGSAGVVLHQGRGDAVPRLPRPDRLSPVRRARPRGVGVEALLERISPEGRRPGARRSAGPGP